MSKRTSPYFTRVLWHLTDINWLPFSSLRKHSFRGNLDSVPAEQHPPASSPVPGAKLLPQLIPFWVPPGVHIRWPSNEWKDLRLFIVSCLPACILYIYMLLSPFVWYWSGLCECVSLAALVESRNLPSCKTFRCGLQPWGQPWTVSHGHGTAMDKSWLSLQFSVLHRELRVGIAGQSASGCKLFQPDQNWLNHFHLVVVPTLIAIPTVPIQISWDGKLRRQLLYRSLRRYEP